MVYFTADTHFGSERTLTLSQRPFANIGEMDNAFISNWNSLVKPEDTVYHLGDFGMFENAKKLNGKIVLLLGNYEKSDMQKNFDGDYSKYEQYLKSFGFEKIVKDGLILDVPEFGEKVFLTHEPLDCKKDMFNLFGHIHKLCLVKKFGLNIGIDNFYFKPATIQNVLFYKEAIQKFYDNNVFCGINDLK